MRSSFRPATHARNVDFSFSEISPRLFSFNSPHGACPECSGLGFMREVDPDKLVVDPDRSIAAGCLATVSNGAGSWYGRLLEQLAVNLEFDLHTPWRELSEPVRELIMFGSDEEYDFVWEGRKGAYRFRDRLEGLAARIERRYGETSSEDIRRELERYMTFAPCSACHGVRLKTEALAVLVDGASIAEISAMPIHRARSWFDDLEMGERDEKIARKILREVRDRLGFLRVGWARIPDARSHGWHVVGRRKSAYSPCNPGGLEAHGRALRPRRAVDRPSSAGQPSAPRHPDRHEGPGQYRGRRRARRRDHPQRRLGHRPWTGGGSPRRHGGRRRNPSRHCRAGGRFDRPLPQRQGVGARARAATSKVAASTSGCSGPRSTT